MTGARSDRSDGTVSRRTALRTAAGLAGGALLAGGAGTAVAQSGGVDFGGWFNNTGNFDGVVDRTGQDQVTVKVGAQGNNGPLAFAPAAIRVDPGTTVTWEWTGQGGPHNVVAKDGSYRSGSPTPEAGTTFKHTFDSEGVSKYYCDPHETVGMKGAVVVGSPGGGGKRKPVWPEYVSGANDHGYEDLRGNSEVTVTVDSNYFEPTRIWVDPGTTVTWEFAAAGHNVKPNSQPADDLAGTEGGTMQTVSSGTTYSATLEAAGMYTYFCGPHETIGMKGAIAVGDAVETEQVGGGGTEFTRPSNATAWLAVFGGLLTTLLLVPFGFAVYLRRRYPEGVPARPEEAPDPRPTAMEAPDADEEPVEELGHDEFDPTGTLSLVLLYLVILGVMWVFMYFVEFLGGGPTVIG